MAGALVDVLDDVEDAVTSCGGLVVARVIGLDGIGQFLQGAADSPRC